MTSRQRSSIGGPVGDNTNIEVSIGTMQSNPGSESVAETFSYNVLNQMVGYQNSNGTSASYTYDATGMRASKTVNGVEKKFYYNGMYILNEGDSTEITATNFIGLTGIEGRKNGANEMAYFMKDAHGDVIKVLDSEDFRADYEYDIWGNQTQDTTNTFDNPFRYCSEYMDEESGLIYLRARYYDPNTGRFTQEDPVKDGANWYAYGLNNPIRYIDPAGNIADGEDQLDEQVQIILNGPNKDGSGGLSLAWKLADERGDTEAKEHIRVTANNIRKFFKSSNINRMIILCNSAGAFGAGHTGVMFITDNGSALFFSYHPDPDGNASAPGEMRIGYLNEDQWIDVLYGNGTALLVGSNGQNRNEKFNGNLYFDVSNAEGRGGLSKGVEIFVNPGWYNLATNNCDHQTASIVSATGKFYDKQILPNDSFTLTTLYYTNYNGWLIQTGIRASN